MWFRAKGLAIIHRMGATIRDQRTGKVVGRALLIPWRGKLHVIGLKAPLQVQWLPQERLTYWKQEIGFATHPPPDFSNIRSGDINRNDSN